MAVEHPHRSDPQQHGGDHARREALHRELASCGYFPELVEDSVLMAVGAEDVVDFVVHHEPTFSLDEVHRHLTVVVLTTSRLVIGHTDEQSPEGPQAVPSAATSTESVPLSSINAAALTRVISRPERHRRGDPASEAWLLISWGAMRRIELEPSTCPDPSCEADHGFTGSMVPDDLVVRMSEAADGADRVAGLVRFATTLQHTTGRGSATTIGR